jgi:hypothetical protein
LVTLGSVVACGAAGSVVESTSQGQCIVYYGGGGIPAPPDGAQACAQGVCNYQSQTGCGVGKTCVLGIDFANKTVNPTCQSTGSLKEREPCDAQGQCGAGLYCAGTDAPGDGGFHGICRKLCCGGDWAACPTGESCIRETEVKFGTELVYANVDLCFPVGTCDVFDSSACQSEGRTCRVVDPTGAVACAPYSNLVAGAPCDRTHQCGAGLTCAGATPKDTSNGTCRKLCRWPSCAEGPTCAAAEGTCVHFDRDPPNAGECTQNWQGKALVAGDGGTLTPLDGGGLFYETDAGIVRRLTSPL